jgi:hypothetical protein
MSISSRITRLERQASGRGCGCRIGAIPIVNEFVDAEGRAIRWTDATGQPLPGPPDIPSCRLCEGRIRYVAVVRRPAVDAAQV